MNNNKPTYDKDFKDKKSDRTQIQRFFFFNLLKNCENVSISSCEQQKKNTLTHNTHILS